MGEIQKTRSLSLGEGALPVPPVLRALWGHAPRLLPQSKPGKEEASGEHHRVHWGGVSLKAR